MLGLDGTTSSQTGKVMGTMKITRKQQPGGDQEAHLKLTILTRVPSTAPCGGSTSLSDCPSLKDRLSEIFQEKMPFNKVQVPQPLWSLASHDALNEVSNGPHCKPSPTVAGACFNFLMSEFSRDLTKGINLSSRFMLL